MPKARRSSTPRPRSTSESGLLAPGSTSKRSSTRPAVPLAVSVAMTRQVPVGRTSRLSLRSVHHRCRMASKDVGATKHGVQVGVMGLDARWIQRHGQDRQP